MSRNTIYGFHQLIISIAALAQKYGNDLYQLFIQNNVPVSVMQNDEEIIHSPVFNDLSALIALHTPVKGWISKAEHGILTTRENEYYLHPILGCRYGCDYCYLQGFSQKRLPIVFHLNFEGLLGDIDALIATRPVGNSPLLFCTGELADSLAETDLYPIAQELISHFSMLETASLELRTKSAKVDQILKIKHGGKSVISFSISPQKYISRYEHGTAQLAERLDAAHRCQLSDYPIAFNIEPLLLFQDWKAQYEGMLQQIVEKLDTRRIHHVSIGCLRWSSPLAMQPKFQKITQAIKKPVEQIEYRFGKINNTLGFSERLDAYQWLKQSMQFFKIEGTIYWSMEEPRILAALEK